VLGALVAFCAMYWAHSQLPVWASLIVSTLLILGFLGVVIKRDLPLSSLPVIGQKFKK
jgi:hypothetical protein